MAFQLKYFLPKPKQLLHVPRWMSDLSEELADTGEYLVYCTDYPLTEDQRLAFAVAQIALEEDKLFFKTLVEMSHESHNT